MLTTQYKNLYFAVDNNKLTNNDEILRINLSSLIPILVKVYQEIFSYIYIYDQFQRKKMVDAGPTFCKRKKNHETFHHRFRSLHFRSRAFPFFSLPHPFVHSEMGGGNIAFSRQPGRLVQDENERSRLRGKIESNADTLLFFTFSSVGRSNRALRIPQLLHYRWILFE